MPKRNSSRCLTKGENLAQEKYIKKYRAKLRKHAPFEEKNAV